MQITSENRYQFFRIRINGIIHMSLKINEIISMQTWIQNDSNYFIQFQTKDTSILFEYDNFDKWKAIIEELDKNKII